MDAQGDPDCMADFWKLYFFLLQRCDSRRLATSTLAR